MKKKKGWLACVLILFSTLTALFCKADKHKKHPVYKFSFHLKDRDSDAQILSAGEASKRISALLLKAGCSAAEYQSYTIEDGIHADSRETLVFAVFVPPEKKAREILVFVKKELNITHAWYVKEEHSYTELKKNSQIKAYF